jgi:small multidrug resistance family-3 protein
MGARRPLARTRLGDGVAQLQVVTGGRSALLFAVAALAEIGGAYLVWVAVKEHGGPIALIAGVTSLGLYGWLVAQQPSHEFGRTLAAYGGVFVVGSLLWGVAFDRFEPDGYDLAGAAGCLLGVTVIMYAPR